MRIDKEAKLLAEMYSSKVKDNEKRILNEIAPNYSSEMPGEGESGMDYSQTYDRGSRTSDMTTDPETDVSTDETSPSRLEQANSPKELYRIVKQAKNNGREEQIKQALVPFIKDSRGMDMWKGAIEIAKSQSGIGESCKPMPKKKRKYGTKNKTRKSRK